MHCSPVAHKQPSSMQMEGKRAPISLKVLDALLEVEASCIFAQALREGPQYYDELPGMAS